MHTTFARNFRAGRYLSDLLADMDSIQALIETYDA